VPRGVAILFACALIAIVLDALLFQYVTKSIAEATQEIIGARAEVDQLVAAKDMLLDAETGARGFLLTGRPEYLEPYAAATSRTTTILAAIAGMPGGNESEKTQADQFNQLARAKLDELARTVETYRAGDRNKAVEMVASGIEKQVMDQVRAIVQERQRLLEQRITNAREGRGRIVRWALAANTAAAAFAMTVFILFGIAIAQHQFRRRRFEQEIQRSNIELEQMVVQRTRELEDSLQTIRGQLAERMRNDAMLRDSEERFRILVAGVKDYAIYMLDPEGNITSWNSGAERIKGYSADEIIGKHFSIFYTEEDRHANVPRNALQVALSEGKYEAEAVRVRKGGQRFVASVVIDSLRDPTGRLIGFAKLTRDVTERHKQQAALDEAKAALAQSQKMEALGHLSGGVAHDFNNLLHVIRNAAEVLSRRLPNLEPDLRDLFDMIKRNTERAASYTQRLLAFARRQPLEPQAIDPNKLVQSMGTLLKSAIGGVIELNVVRGVGSWSIWADPNQLETAILNLAVNARDAMPNGGRLTIETTNAYLDQDYAASNEGIEAGQYTLICVSDTGIGMTPDVMAKAFEPFFTTKDLGHGTGLGLSQVYGFIKQSGGHVKIDSHPGQGTAVELYLPRLRTTVEAESRDEAKVPSATATETILVVEDEKDVLEFTATILRELGYRVFTANDAESALAILEQVGSADLLFTDVGLPGVNGLKLADQALKRWPKLKVLFTSGHSRDAIFNDGGLDPQLDLIAKPFSQSALAKRVRAVLAT
jgi:PAS domain S-box-containing protein